MTVGALALAACNRSGPGSVPARDPGPALDAIDRKLEGMPPTGAESGELFLRRAEILERAGRLAEAARDYDRAAFAFAQSPEATDRPVERARRAEERARRVRERMRP